MLYGISLVRRLSGTCVRPCRTPEAAADRRCRTLGRRGQKAEKVRAIQRAFTVSLVEGTNTLWATAFSQGRVEARSSEISISVDVAEGGMNLYVVSVGIDNYKNRWYNLNYGVSGAQALVAGLSKLGAEIFQNIHVQTILDEQATRSGIEAALERVEEDARPEDTFVFYYAGHGVMDRGSTWKSADLYLIPADVTQLYGNDSLLAEKAISAMHLREMFRRIEARRQLAIMDLCQSGQWNGRRNFRDRRRSNKPVPRFLFRPGHRNRYQSMEFAAGDSGASPGLSGGGRQRALRALRHTQ